MDEMNDELRDSAIEHHRSASSRLPSRWEENHGNILLLLLGLIMIVGAGILAYQQSRFVPPRFPNGDLIETPSVAFVSGVDGRENLAVVRVQGAKSDEGMIRIAIFDSLAGFADPNGAILAETVPIKDGAASVGLVPERLPEQFAIAAYHDLDGDGQLSFNQFGIPVESYGFSNNVRSFVGPPAYEQAAIKRPEPGDEIVISLD